ncbi:MAG TPA: hypothetical protein VH370_07940 [Humisphaera sp.]|nr:hypothetical protein [Humisphaera sp.]
MKRLRRILGNAAAIVSLVLCLACVGFWVRSCFAWDYVDYTYHRDGATRFVSVASSDGVVQVAWCTYTRPISRRGLDHATNKAQPRDDHFFRWANYLGPDWLGEVCWGPFWAIVTLFATWPLIWALFKRKEIRRRRRMRSGHCQSCGYDLRATPDRCPECGATPGAAR